MDYIRKRIYKKTAMVFVVLCVLSMFAVFTPETVKAGVYDNAYTFYQTYGSEMSFQAGANNQGEIYYATKAKKDVYTGIQYTTIGWKVRIFNSADALVETIYYKLGGSNMSSVNVCTVNGYEYCLYRVTLANMKSRMSQAGLNALNNPNCNIIFDACTTTKINGQLQGGMTDSGPSWGSVYTTYNGIVNAQDWSATTKETLKTYYNKAVDGLFYNVTLYKGAGISQVLGAGKYCFGTKVTISAKAEEGYHFTSWTGSGSSTQESYSFVLYGNNVSFTANAGENSYKIVFDGNGGEGGVAPQTIDYTGSLTMPREGFLLEGSTLAGWTTTHEVSTVQFSKGQTVSIKTLANEMKVQNTDGATITLYATWDYGPMIKTKEIYVSLQDAKQGKITEEWLAKRAEAIDQEDGEIPYGQNPTTSFLMEDYQVNDFTEFTDSGIVTETFLAVDSAGNATKKRIMVHIVDTQIYPANKIMGKVRFISSKYFKDTKGDLISEENGGLEDNSIWRLDEEFRGLLEKLFGD